MLMRFIYNIYMYLISMVYMIYLTITFYATGLTSGTILCIFTVLAVAVLLLLMLSVRTYMYMNER